MLRTLKTAPLLFTFIQPYIQNKKHRLCRLIGLWFGPNAHSSYEKKKQKHANLERLSHNTICVKPVNNSSAVAN